MPGSKVGSEISALTKDQQRQSSEFRVDSEISAATKDQQRQSPSSKVDSEISAATKEKQQQLPGSVVDLEISALMKDPSKLSMNDSFFDNQMETVINAGFKAILIVYGQIMGTLRVFLAIFLWKSSRYPKWQLYISTRPISTISMEKNIL